MRPLIRYTLGIATAVHVTVAPTASAQAARPNACALVDAPELIRLTGRKDFSGRGPKLSPPSEVPAPDMSLCHFLGVTFALRNNMTAERFARIRRSHEAGSWKVQSISGLGDEAFSLWDPSPGSRKSVLIDFRSGSKQVSLEDVVPSDSVEATKKLLLSIAKSIAPRVR